MQREAKGRRNKVVRQARRKSESPGPHRTGVVCCSCASEGVGGCSRELGFEADVDGVHGERPAGESGRGGRNLAWQVGCRRLRGARARMAAACVVSARLHLREDEREGLGQGGQ